MTNTPSLEDILTKWITETFKIPIYTDISEKYGSLICWKRYILAMVCDKKVESGAWFRDHVIVDAASPRLFEELEPLITNRISEIVELYGP